MWINILTGCPLCRKLMMSIGCCFVPIMYVFELNVAVHCYAYEKHRKCIMERKWHSCFGAAIALNPFGAKSHCAMCIAVHITKTSKCVLAREWH